MKIAGSTYCLCSLKLWMHNFSLLRLCFIHQTLCSVNVWNVEDLMLDCICSCWHVGCWNYPALHSQRLLSFFPFTRWSECPGRDHDIVWYRENKEACCEAGWVTLLQYASHLQQQQCESVHCILKQARSAEGIIIKIDYNVFFPYNTNKHYIHIWN